MTRLRRLLALLAAALAVAILSPPAASAEPRRPAIVALGDSAASGEGAGGYEAGTRGEHGNWCHRSTDAWIHHTGLGVESVNLACSGAAAADVGFGAGTHYTETSQASRLLDLARRYLVSLVVVQVGANDDAALTDTTVACIRAFVDPVVRPCRAALGPLLPGRMVATAARVETAVRDVREAMRRAGYRDGGYALVVSSYAAPATERMVELAASRGCPLSRRDAGWGRTVLFPQLSTALRGVAERVGARFLDLTRATEGREACSRQRSGQEWQRRLTVDAGALVHGGLGAVGLHLAQESFHPTAAAHAEMGRCLGEFARSGRPAGACLVGPDGRLHLDGGVAAPAA